MRRLLNPLLKLFFNPNKISAALHVQAKVNQEFHQRFRQREDMDPLYYELVHNLALEVTRLGIEVHNMKMRVESVGSRMDFDERRGRALETVVQYKQPRPPQTQRPPQQPRQQQQQPAAAVAPPESAAPSSVNSAIPSSSASSVSSVSSPISSSPVSSAIPVDRPDGEGERRRRRRRRRRRPGQTMGDQQAGAPNGNGTSTWVGEGGNDADNDADDVDDAGPAGNDAQ